MKNVLVLYLDRRIFFLERFAASLAFVPFNYSFDFSLHVSSQHIKNSLVIGEVSNNGLERNNVTSGLCFPNQLSIYDILGSCLSAEFKTTLYFAEYKLRWSFKSWPLKLWLRIEIGGLGRHNAILYTHQQTI